MLCIYRSRKTKIIVPACLFVVNTLIYDFGQNKLSSTHSSRHWLQTFFRVKRREVLSSGPGRIKILLIKSWVWSFYETESEVLATLVIFYVLCTYVFITFWSRILNQFGVLLRRAIVAMSKNQSNGFYKKTDYNTILLIFLAK